MANNTKLMIVYDINLCRICQIPTNLDLTSTSSIVKGSDNDQTHLDIIKFIFNDILWIEDNLVSVACSMCLKKVIEIAAFKRLCLKTNSQRGLIEIGLVKVEDVTEIDDPLASSPEVDMETDGQISETEEIPLSQWKLTCDLKQLPKQQIKTRTAKQYRKRTTQKIKVKKTQHSLKVNHDEVKDKSEVPKIARKLKRLKSKPDCKFKCDICGEEQFRDLRYLERHIFRHNGTRNYICTICGRKYITHGDLITHAKSHSEELKFECDICNKRFKAIRNLQIHKAIVHVDKKDFKHLCTICGKKFVTADRLKGHINRHNQVKTYSCELCDKSFVSKCEMLRHSATHSNIRAFKCDLCPFEYKQKVFLAAHKSRKHGIGNYSHRLKESDKPFQCRLCDAKFKCESNIKPHLKRKHDANVNWEINFDLTEYYVVLKPSPQDNEAESA